MNKKMDHNYWKRIMDDIAEASTCRVMLGCIILRGNFIVGVGYLGSISGDHHCDDETKGMDDGGDCFGHPGVSIPNTRGCLFVDNNGLQGVGDGNRSCIRTVHAEMNAILKTSARGEPENWLTCYSTYSPCLNCYKALLQIGVRNFYFEKDYKDVNRDILMKNHSPELRLNISWVKV